VVGWGKGMGLRSGEGGAALLFFAEDGEVFVDGFSGSVAEGSRVGIDDGADLDGSEVFEGFAGELVFFVEVGGDDEEAVVVEAVEGLVEDFAPDRLVVPIILVTEEDDVGGSDFGEFFEEVAAMGDEVGVHLFAERFFPAGIGLFDFGGADVEALEVGGVGFFGEELCEDARFVASTAGEVEEAEVLLFAEMRVEEIAQVAFEGCKVTLEKFTERSVGHGKTLIKDWDIGI